ncbi:MAG: hypothetical protein CL606_06910 [Anaerolineaceae bacterium]|nr:hypothetical protein [Anaerolineaceae bacterium]HCU80757.1 hypothetical protein [Chloroflexota bacterium]|tara:strand:- start:3791 stop:4201 length:411 start_codon:yes stop_codon:yes gene_type:complete
MARVRISDRVTEVYLAASTLMFVGWGGLLALLLFTVPTVDARWMFFLLALSALTGTAIPFIIFLARRFGKTPISVNVLIRRAIWVGVIGCILAWLQLGRALTWTISLLIVSVIVGIEWLIEIRERSLWNPDNVNEE